jgi:mono/diheme cytochrome c family protein
MIICMLAAAGCYHDPPAETPPATPDAEADVVTEPDVTFPDVTEPDITEPDVPEGDVTEPDVPGPDVPEGDVTEPDVTNAACDDPELAANTKELLERACYPCHGLLGKTEGGMGHVLDAGKLVDLGQVVPGEPDLSALFIRMNAGQMPPANTDAPLPTADEIAMVGDWIACGAEPLYEEADRPFMSPTDVITTIRDDLEAITPSSQRKFTRYFSLANLYNSGVSTNDLNGYRAGLAKMVNSLSLGSKIVNPVSINDNKTIYRISTDDYGWDYNPNNPDVDIWESIVREYPYGIRYEDEIADQNIEDLSETKMAYVNADWFVATASQPRLYHVILQLPNDEKGLEQMVGVNTLQNIADGSDGLRAGFTQSGVSNSNRIIERHEANMGMYWKSYDFAQETGQGNIMYFSLGPQSPDFTDEENAQLFTHDGGEMVFALPNGLHAYLITTVKGCRLDEAPTEIVDNPDQPQGATIENGFSCMYCHREGIIPATDDVRGNWENYGVGAPNFTPDGPLDGQEYVEQIYDLYVSEEVLTEAQNEDRADYKEALEATGAVFGEYDPVSLLKFEFDEDMDGERVAAELGITSEEFGDYVIAFPQLAGLVGGAASATVGRDTFQENFAQIVCTIFLGDPLKFHPVCGDDCVPDCGNAVCGDHDGCGGTCGDCAVGDECVAGNCYPVCVDPE